MSPALVVVVKNINIVTEKQLDMENISQYIEQTLLKPDISKEQIKNLIEESLQYQFLGVCVPPYFVKYARELIGEKNLKLVTVIGFPLGYQMVSAKTEETRKAIEDGADELDMVINIAAIKSGEYNHVKDGVEGVATLCRLKSKPLKVIIETGLLEEEEIIKTCELLAEIGVDFVKTSTGFNGTGATVETVKLLRQILPSKIGIKASGGIRTYEFACQLIEAGASRIGTSSGVQIVKEMPS